MHFVGSFYIGIAQSIGTAVAQWLRCCATNHKAAGSIPAGVSGYFIDIKSFRLHYGPGVDSASNRNEYQEYFLGVKADNLPPSCAVVTKSTKLNFLETSGPLQACNGSVLPLPLPFYHKARLIKIVKYGVPVKVSFAATLAEVTLLLPSAPCCGRSRKVTSASSKPVLQPVSVNIVFDSSIPVVVLMNLPAPGRW